MKKVINIIDKENNLAVSLEVDWEKKNVHIISDKEYQVEEAFGE